MPKEWHLTDWPLTYTDICIPMYTHIYKYTHAHTRLGKGNVNRWPSDEHVLRNVLMSFGLDDVPILFSLITSFMSSQHQPLNCCDGLFYGSYVSAWKVMRNPDTCSNKSFEVHMCVLGVKLTFSLINGESGLLSLLWASCKQWKIQVEDETDIPIL